eukprot:Nitzschia sp. Nitz4//scaffold196_size54656//37773//38870//NITZ4_006644-RA/size54656-snap-gene-0.34-mRNA-1//-1//CDS//3329540441//8944//frame0
MKLSIIVPTCTNTREETFSPKSQHSFRFQNPDESTVSTAWSSDPDDFSADSGRAHGMDLPMKHNRLETRSPEISDEDMYNMLVVGNAPTVPAIVRAMEADGSVAPTSENALHSSQQMLSDEELYQQLVSNSFHSVSSGFSRQVVFRAQSAVWDPEMALPTNINEDEEEEPENQFLSMIENGEMYRALVVSPLMMAASAISLAPGEPVPKTKKAVDLSDNNVEKTTLLEYTECLQKDFHKTVRQLQKQIGCVPLNDEDHVTFGDNTSKTRLSADLRRQRLRNQALQSERDTLSHQNMELRQTLLDKQTELQAMRMKLLELEGTKMKVEQDACERDLKAASALNDLLESFA